MEDEIKKKNRKRAEIWALKSLRDRSGYSMEEIDDARNSSVTYGDFFQNAPFPNPNRKAIKGVVCGIRVETIDEPLMQEIRYLDKLIDELARGKSLEKILHR